MNLDFLRRELRRMKRGVSSAAFNRRTRAAWLFKPLTSERLWAKALFTPDAAARPRMAPRPPAGACESDRLDDTSVQNRSWATLHERRHREERRSPRSSAGVVTRAAEHPSSCRSSTASCTRSRGGMMSAERQQHTLQATALVHEAYLRLVDNDCAGAARQEFLAAAANAMRRVSSSTTHARAKAEKRGRNWQRVTLQGVGDEEDEELDVVAIHEALERLEAIDPQQARVVELRFFAGMTGTRDRRAARRVAQHGSTRAQDGACVATPRARRVAHGLHRASRFSRLALAGEVSQLRAAWLDHSPDEARHRALRTVQAARAAWAARATDQNLRPTRWSPSASKDST